MKKISRFDWRLVRGIGQLHLLNRASMFLLVFVPILAAVWPTVRQALDTALGRTTFLPMSWAYLFGASLGTLSGRTFFQLACPEMIKDMSLAEYVRSKKREYAEAPSLAAVNQAIQSLESLGVNLDIIDLERQAEKRIESELALLRDQLEKNDSEIRHLKEAREVATKDEREKYDSKLYELTNESREFRDHLRRYEERDRGDRGPDFRRKMSLVELSASHTYLREASTNKLFMFFCALCYAAAIGLIIIVIVHQTKSVASAAGWL